MASFETEAFTLLAIAIIVIAVRTYARLTSAGLSNFQLDDYLMLVAAVSQVQQTMIYQQRLKDSSHIGHIWLRNRSCILCRGPFPWPREQFHDR